MNNDCRAMLMVVVCGFTNVCWAQALPPGERKEPRTVSVQGQGKVAAVPDVATIVAEVTEEGQALDRISAQVRQTMGKIMAAAKLQGVADRDLQTLAYHVQPRFEYDRNRNAKRAGYQVTNRLQLRIRDLDKVGKVLGAVVDAGANNVIGPDFDVDNPRELETQAMKRAVEDARRKATVLAEAAGAALGSVQSISPSGPVWPMPKPMMMRGMAMAQEAAAAEPVAAGEQTISATVTVTYELK